MKLTWQWPSRTLPLLFFISRFIFAVAFVGQTSRAGTFCPDASNPTQRQAQNFLIDTAIVQCKKSLESEQCKRFLFANPRHKENDVKTCSREELAQSTDLMAEASRKALAEKYGKKAETFWKTVKNIPNLRLPTNLATLTLTVGTVIFDSLGKWIDYTRLGFKSASECFDKNEVCLGKLLAITDAEIEKLKIKTAGFECLKPEVQASLVTLATVESAEIAGLAPENLLLQTAAGKIAKKLTKEKKNDEADTTDDSDPDRRQGSDVMVARSPARQEMMDEITDKRKNAFMARINSAAFTQQAEADLKGSKNASRRLYFIRENAHLKGMNDETHDFDFVTSLNLFDQMNFDHELELLLGRPENADLFKHLGKENGTHKYRDGKTFQGSFDLEGLTDEQEERLVKLINEACTNNMNTATQKFAPLHRKSEEGSTSDLPDNLASAYKCGVGYNHIASGHAARRARNESKVAATELSDFRNYGKMAEPLVNKAQTALQNAKDLRSQLSSSEWKKLWNSDNDLFSLDVFEALRKSNSPHELVGKIKEYARVDLTQEQANRIYHYKNSIDALSPGFLDEGADILDFDAAHFGGLKSDFPNVGARNFEALAEALRDTKSAPDGSGLNDLPQRLKRAEEKVTASLGQQKTELSTLVKKVFSNVTCMKTSGDDGSTHFGCPVTRNVKQEFISQASQNSHLKNTRFVFFAENVVADDRMGLSNHGEFLEKEIRSFLRQGNSFKKDELKNLTMALDLQGERLWQGKIDMIIANESKLTAEQKKTLDLAFDNALKKLATENAGHSDYNRAVRFYSEKSPLPERGLSPAP